MFKYRAYNLPNFAEMPTECPVCQLRFEREPGFYYGAMYVSYAFSVALVVILGTMTFYILENPDLWVYATVIFTIVLFLVPLLFRYSRIIYLYAFGGVKFKDPHSH
jgi:uncharacterized protein (DUF983 family)